VKSERNLDLTKREKGSPMTRQGRNRKGGVGVEGGKKGKPDEVHRERGERKEREKMRI